MTRGAHTIKVGGDLREIRTFMFYTGGKPGASPSTTRPRSTSPNGGSEAYPTSTRPTDSRRPMSSGCRSAEPGRRGQGAVARVGSARADVLPDRTAAESRHEPGAHGHLRGACSARPDRVGAGNRSKDSRTLQRLYDVSAFRVIAAGGADRRVGNGGRNVLVSAGTNNWDLQVFKDFRIREGHNLEFRWESFNAFNHTKWGGAGTNMEAPETFRCDQRDKVAEDHAVRAAVFVLDPEMGEEAT